MQRMIIIIIINYVVLSDNDPIINSNNPLRKQTKPCN